MPVDSEHDVAHVESARRGSEAAVAHANDDDVARLGLWRGEDKTDHLARAAV